MYKDYSREDLISSLEYFKNEYVVLCSKFIALNTDFKKLSFEFTKLSLEYNKLSENERFVQLCLL